MRIRTGINAGLGAVLVFMLAGSSAAADQMPGTASLFTLARLRSICASQEDLAIGFCRGFIVSAFETASMLKSANGGGLCLDASIDAANLAQIVKGSLASVSATRSKEPALPLVLSIIQRQFSCQ